MNNVFACVFIAQSCDYLVYYLARATSYRHIKPKMQ